MTVLSDTSLTAGAAATPESSSQFVLSVINLDEDVVAALASAQGRSISSAANDALRGAIAGEAHRAALLRGLDELDAEHGSDSTLPLSRSWPDPIAELATAVPGTNRRLAAGPPPPLTHVRDNPPTTSVLRWPVELARRSGA